MKINVLPSEIANMIAAGEVVERPSSVVKELAENSVDAGAKNITIEIKKGGMTFIRISDDGCGIGSDQAETAFLRHATSKISCKEDLNSIFTLGFRGEALASIAAVAKVDMFTKPKEQAFGYSVSVEGGTVTESSESGCPDGTTIIVRDLFFNTPARMKFLKNDATETSYVSDVVNKLILSHPEISFRFINNGKQVIKSSGDGKLINAIGAVFGRDYVRNLTEVDFADDNISVSGYIGNSAISRKDRRHQIFYINGRNVASRVISAACGEGFQNTLMTGRFPVAVLNINVNAGFVDVNVHPTKMEVRFSDDKKVYSAVYWAIKNTLSGNKYVPEIKVHINTEPPKIMKAPEVKKEENKSINMLKDAYINSYNPPTFNESSFEYTVGKSEPAEPPARELAQSASNETSKPLAKKEPLKNEEQQKEVSQKELPKQQEQRWEQSVESSDGDEELTSRFCITQEAKDEAAVDSQATQKEQTQQNAKQKYVANVDFKVCGQVFNTYIIVQMDSDMLIIDQHAAHERLYFESFVEDYRNKTFCPQVLLIPITLDFTPYDYDLVIKNTKLFSELGFEIDAFGNNTVIVRQIPYAEDEHIVKDTIVEVVELLRQNAEDVKKDLVEEALHTMACKKAIKGNRELSRAEMEALVENVLMMDDINTCPHGRPITVKMSKYSIEKQFKRIV